jgi:2-oxoglutarate ferredoxin oxidoreductase subunit delta
VPREDLAESFHEQARVRLRTLGVPLDPVAASPSGRVGRPAISNLYVGERRVHRAPTIVDFVNIRWVDEWCKRCNICVEICPKDTLVLTHDAIIEAEDCIRCGLCERYCPDFAIEVLPKRDADGDLPPEIAAQATSSVRWTTSRGHTPDAARGPGVAGTNPTRGITDAESVPREDRANPT